METREIKEYGIVLGSSDLGEADRLITLLTINSGKIVAKIKGVKKPKAKLSYASFPFNMGEYLLVKRGRSFTVTNCNYIDNFGNLTADLNKYYAGAGCLEVAKLVTKENMDSYKLFMLLSKTLKELNYNENCNIFTVLSKFMVEVLDYVGFKLSIDETSGTNFDFSNGRLGAYTDENCVSLTTEDAEELKKLITTSVEDIDYKTATTKTVLKLLVLFFENKVNEEIKILKRFI